MNDDSKSRYIYGAIDRRKVVLGMNHQKMALLHQHLGNYTSIFCYEEI